MLAISLVERAEEEARQTLRRQEAGARLAARLDAGGRMDEPAVAAGQGGLR